MHIYMLYIFFNCVQIRSTLHIAIENAINNEIQFACQCSYDYTSNIKLTESYFSCQHKDYITYRTGIFSHTTMAPISFVTDILNKWINGTSGRSIVVTANALRYNMAEGKCGLVIPSINTSFCEGDTQTGR